MVKNSLRWLLAIVITLSSVVFQRLTGPTHPVRGKVTLGQETIKYRLKRTHGGPDDHIVKITVKDTTINGKLLYRRYETSDSMKTLLKSLGSVFKKSANRFRIDSRWTMVTMTRVGDQLAGALPHQPPAGKLEYDVILQRENEKVSLADGQNVIIRFKGAVPLLVLIPHVVFMFGAMLVSTRAGIAALAKNGKLKWLTYWTVGLLCAGGLIFGPIVQKYAFDALWTGWPFGTDLTDNKTLIAFIGWLPALVAMHRNKNARWWVLAAAILLFVIFMIPHSLLGSELSYSKMK